MSLTDADAPTHQARFEARANQLIPGIAQRIDATFVVTPQDPKNPNGGFDVEPTEQFYVLTMQLAAALFSLHSKKVNAIPGFDYMHRNMGAGSYSKFEKSLEGKLKQPGNAKHTPAELAFRSMIPAKKDFGVPRRNAVVYMYFTEVFKMAFENVDWGR